jgi:serine/threonine protein kinase
MRNATLLNAQVGEYRMLDYLGAGGMGEVYRAVHAKLGRVVAIKVLSQAHRNPRLLERFRNEAQIQARLHYPGIAALFDFVETDGVPCIVMEYVDGHTLDELIRVNGILPLETTLSVFQQLVEAIAYVHDHEIIHRDIKSNNIKITSKGEMKLLDFGIAKSDDSPNLTATGDVIGTLQYLSPEQLKGGVADERSDVWALGVVLYEMVSGQTPFDATTLGRLCEKISKSDYVSPSTFNPALPKEVEAIVSRCLKKNAAARYQSAREILADLERLQLANRLERLQQANRAVKEEKSATTPLNHPALIWAKQNWKLCSALVTVLLAVFVLSLFALRKPDGNIVLPEPAKDQPQANTRELRTVRVNALEGKAEVYKDGQLIGQTPYEVRAALGEQISLMLKRDGYADKRVDFAITEGKKEYTVVLNPVK